MTNPPQPWPVDPDALACIACNGAESEQRRNRALNDLSPFIRTQADEVGARFNRSIWQDLIEEGVSHVGLKIKHYRPDRETPFVAWLCTVLYRLGCTLRRRRSTRDPINKAGTGWDEDRERKLNQVAAQPQEPESASETNERLEYSLRRMRDVLKRINWPLCRSIDLFALLLLETRLRLGMAFRASLDNATFDPGDIMRCAETLLPWTAEQERRWIRSGWPTLRACWTILAPLLDQAALTTDDLLVSLSGHIPPPGVSAGCWGNWVYRACLEARQKMSCEEWNDLFARLFPGRR